MASTTSDALNPSTYSSATTRILSILRVPHDDGVRTLRDGVPADVLEASFVIHAREFFPSVYASPDSRGGQRMIRLKAAGIGLAKDTVFVGHELQRDCAATGLQSRRGPSSNKPTQVGTLK